LVTLVARHLLEPVLGADSVADIQQQQREQTPADKAKPPGAMFS